MIIPGHIKIEKVPSITCKKCGSFRVMITDNGPECEECDIRPHPTMDLTEEVEYFIHQIRREETNSNETF